MRKFDNTEEWIEKVAEYIIRRFWDISKYKVRGRNTISAIFLAGAPWAGKTEFLDTIFNDVRETFIIIDIDKYRKHFKWYDWDNSSEFQKCSVKVADKILSFCFKNNLNFVFDWTFRNYNKVKQNFKQCVKFERNSLITLIFQNPRTSFYYTYLRKIYKQRNVPIDVFIEWFYNSIQNTFKAYSEFNWVEIMIAEKKYHPLNKDIFNYKIDYETNNLSDFCRKYFIIYRKWEFVNKERLKLDLKNFQNILDAHFLWKSTFFSKIRLWLIEKGLKLF